MRRILTLAGGLLLAAAVQAQQFPSKPVTLIVMSNHIRNSSDVGMASPPTPPVSGLAKEATMTSIPLGQVAGLDLIDADVAG